MKDKYKTKKQLIDELEVLRRRVAAFEGLAAKSKGMEEAEDRSDMELSQVRRVSDLYRHSSLLDRMNGLVQLSEEILAESAVKGLLKRVVDGARDLTGAKTVVSGHLHGESGFQIAASSRSPERTPCLEGESFTLKKGGVYLEIIEKGQPLRLTEEELYKHPAWRGLPEGHPPLKGLLGAPLKEYDGGINGLIMLSDKESGDFTEEDESLLSHLSVFVSLALQHIGAREEAESKAAEVEEEKKTLEVVMENVPTGITLADFPSMKLRTINKYGRKLLGIPSEQELKGKSISDILKGIEVLEKDGVTPCRDEDLPLTRAMHHKETVSNREIVVILPDGQQANLLCSAGPLLGQGGDVTGGVLAWRDISHLKATEKALKESRDELEKRVQERTAALLKTKQELEVEMEERKEAELMLRQANQLLENVFNTTNFCIAYMDMDFNFIRVNPAYAAADGREPEFFIGKNHFDLYPYEENEEIFRRVVETAKPHTAFAKPFEYPQHPERGTTYWDWMLHPVKDETGKTEGLLLCLTNVTERIRAQEKSIQSERQLRALSTKVLQTQEMERKFISKDIHDSIGSSLAAVKFRLEQEISSMGQNRLDRGVPLEETVDILKGIIKETRRICTDLRPSILDNMGLLATIRWFLREFQGTYHHMAIEEYLHIQEKEVPEPLKVIMFRILQEALNNTAKHSKATLVRIKLSRKRDCVTLAIEDNGEGFDLKKQAAVKSPISGMGLASMKERAELSGGSFRVVSSQGKGTAVRASWPCRESAGSR